jgi:hypothetical protein
MGGGRHRKGCLPGALPAAAGVVLAVVLAVSGCSKPPVTGTVTHRQHSDSYTYVTNPCVAWATRYYTTRVKSGNTYVTSTRSSQYCVAHVTHFNTMPATWGLCLKGTDEDGKEASGCFDVDSGTWSRYPEGVHYP